MSGYYNIDCYDEIQMKCRKLIKTRINNKFNSILSFIKIAGFNGAVRIYEEGKKILINFNTDNRKLQTRAFGYNGGTGYLYKDVESVQELVNDYEQKFNEFIKEWNVIVKSCN